MKKKKLNEGKALNKIVPLPDKDSKPLTREFYSQEVVSLAKALLGKIIVRKLSDSLGIPF